MLKILSYSVFYKTAAVSIPVDNIFKPILQGDDCGMLYPFVRIVDDFTRLKVSLFVPFGCERFQDDMFTDNGPDIGETVINADLLALLGMPAAAVKTSGFGYIVKQGTCPDQTGIGGKTVLPSSGTRLLTIASATRATTNECCLMLSSIP